MANAVTITQIAEAAGVSTATVDRVLNARPGVNPATVQKVQAAMQAMGAGVPSRGRPPSSPNYRFGFVLPADRLGFADQVDRRHCAGGRRLSPPTHHRSDTAPAG